MDMHDPAHPGELLQGCIDDLNMSVAAFAEHIGISRPMLSRILNGHAAISANMDIRLAEALGTYLWNGGKRRFVTDSSSG